MDAENFLVGSWGETKAGRWAANILAGTLLSQKSVYSAV